MKMSFADAINLALVHEMESDPRVVVFGLDVADHKRILGTTKNLVEQFGEHRCFSTPLSEDAMTGVAIGMATAGLRPVHTHIRADFVLLSMNQLVNMASTMNYMSQGKVKCPLVVRAMIGRGWGQGPQHSKSLQSYFAHIPGLKVVMPATPQDAYTLMRASIQDDNPVIFLEHRWSHFAVDEVQLEKPLKLVGSECLRSGTDLTVVCTSWMAVEALKAAQIMERKGIHLEIINIKTLSPLDVKPIIESVRKTKRCIVADYDWTFCGYSAEVTSQVYNALYNQLLAPIERLGFQHVPCPTTRPLENLFYASSHDIVKTAEKLLGIDSIDLSQETQYSHEIRFKGPF